MQPHISMFSFYMGFIVNILSVAFTSTLQAAHTYSNSSALYFEGFTGLCQHVTDTSDPSSLIKTALLNQ